MKSLSIAAALCLACSPSPLSSGNPLAAMSTRQREEFRDCTYVYDRVDEVRECLVIRKGWPVADAAAVITAYQEIGQQIVKGAEDAALWAAADSAGTSCYAPANCDSVARANRATSKSSR